MMLSPPIEFVAPLLLASAATIVVLNSNSVLDESGWLSVKDQNDPAGWRYANEWLPGAVRGRRFYPLPDETIDSSKTKAETTTTTTKKKKREVCFVETSAAGKWRALKRHDSIQSVTLWDTKLDMAIHGTAGNEYLKTMASVYLATNGNDDVSGNLPSSTRPSSSLLSSSTGSGPPSLLYLGLGAGTLPMMVGEPARAVELDPDVTALAKQFCGLDSELVRVVKGNALHFDSYRFDDLGKVDSNDNGNKDERIDTESNKERPLEPHLYQAIFVDVFGADNNVPPSFCKTKFVQRLYDNLHEGGRVIANFHRGTPAEDERLEEATAVYRQVFSDTSLGKDSSGCCCRVPVRYQGNTILCAVKRPQERPQEQHNREDKPQSIATLLRTVDTEKLNTDADQRGWLFDPAARLQRIQD